MKQANGQKPVSRVRASVVLSIASVVFTGLTVLGIWLMWRYMDDPTKVREIIGDHYVLGALCMILISAVQVVVALIPGELVEISAGYVFGAWGGVLLCLAGTTLGSVLVLLLVPAGSISQELKTTALAVSLATLAMGNVAFLLYDRALHNLLQVYQLVWRP